jgi:NAD(P)-dependent dehydrogenase (short-subunit alcohol dehydrogenase family)
MRIEGKAAVVTGGASGLGEAVVCRLRQEGARVAILDSNAALGTAVAMREGAIFCEVDVSNDASVAAALAKAREAHGSEAILVNCAGMSRAQRTVSGGNGAPLASFEMDAFRAVVNVNLVGTFRMIAACALAMAGRDDGDADASRGVIVNTASIAAIDGQTGQAAYAASKAGIVGLTLPVARDLARYGVRIITLLPGAFHTPMFDGMTEEQRRSIGATVPYPARLGRPCEFAQMVVAVIENEMMNGEAVRIDGALRLAPK